MDLAEPGLDDKKYFELHSDTSLMSQIIKERNIYNIRHYLKKLVSSMCVYKFSIAPYYFTTNFAA